MNKLMVITGGTKGIGRAIVNKFAKHQFDVVTCSRNADDLENLRDAHRNEHSAIYTLPVDVSKTDEIKKFVFFIKKIQKPIDILVNNAGTYVPGQVHSEPEGVLDKMLRTNLYSAYHLTRGLIDTMIARKKGQIFNICSTASIMPYVNGGSYCISKYAVLGMTKVLREEMKNKGIKVTAVLPGATYTSSWEKEDIDPKRLMSTDDIANIIFDTYHLSESTVVEEILIRPQLGDI